MVVSAILTTILAPVTGALFGASYGTAIRIGYEIIFPALFKNTKANPDAQEVIKSLHTMFTATGGKSALEFGVAQGIEMAKKKTESPEVVDLINLSLGISDEQLRRRGKAQQFQDPIKDKPRFEDVRDFKVTGDVGDFHNMTNAAITTFFKQFKRREPFDTAFKLLQAEKGNTSFTRQIWATRPAAADVPDAIDTFTLPDTFVREVAHLYQLMVAALQSMKFNQTSGPRGTPHLSRIRADKLQFLRKAREYNRLVAANRKPQLQVDTAKSLEAMRIVSKT